MPSAILLFEAASQHSPENAEAWYLLGTSQVMFATLMPVIFRNRDTLSYLKKTKCLTNEVQTSLALT